MLLLVGATTPAEGAQVLSGETSQSRRIAVWTSADGRVEQVAVRWRARCARPGARITERTVFRRPFDSSTPDRFADAGVYRLRQRGGYRIRVRIRIDGARDPAAQRWNGTLRVDVVVRRHGRRFDRCRTRGVTWGALPPAPPGGVNPTYEPADPAQASTPTPSEPEVQPGPAPTPPSTEYAEWTSPAPGPWRFEISGDDREYITDGQTYSYGPPNDAITVWAVPERVRFAIETADDNRWSGVFAAPPGEQLVAGRTYTGARRYPFNESSPGMEIDGMYRGCNEISGEFTVHEIAFDDRGLLDRFLVTFAQQCVGHKGTARGTIEFTAADG